MSKAGDIVENPVTGERAVARVGTEESGGELLEVDLYVRPGGAVVGERGQGSHRYPSRLRARSPRGGWRSQDEFELVGMCRHIPLNVAQVVVDLPVSRST
jgi:hypothetical protein